MTQKKKKMMMMQKPKTVEQYKAEMERLEWLAAMRRAGQQKKLTGQAKKQQRTRAHAH